MRIEIYVQARMGSTRLPGKVLRPVMNKPLLAYLIERLRHVTEADAFAILTTTAKQDDAIVKLCQELDVPCYRGPEEDVLLRYYQVAQQRRPDAIVRITADCPLIDPQITDQVIRTFRQAWPKWDYVSTQHFPRGLDTEVFSYAALERAALEAKDPAEREHVTPYLYRYPELFHTHLLKCPTDLSHHRWTVDTLEDFKLVELILKKLYTSHPVFHMQEIVDLLQQHPEWVRINAHIKQKTL